MLLLAVLVALIYLLLPAKLTISTVAYAPSTFNGTRQVLQHENRWQNWWPAGNLPPNDHWHYFRNIGYRIAHLSNNSVKIDVKQGSAVFSSLLMIIPIRVDSTGLDWQCLYRAGRDPLSRLLSYSRARQLKQNMRALLDSLQTFLSKPENVYGIPISESTIQDTALVAIKTVYNHRPQTAEVYSLVEQLEQYIAASGARAVNPPMLNVSEMPKNSSRFETMVAIPVNKLLPGKGAIMLKRMIHSPIAVTQVQGGDGTVRQGFASLQQYVEDTHRMQPVIPYAVLVTDRRRETDTAKWITRICFPIF